MHRQVSFLCQVSLNVLLLSLGFTAAASPITARAAPIDPEAGWAVSYLVNTVMVREYEAVLATFNQVPKDRAALDAFYVSDTGKALWVRGQFGALALRARAQDLSGLSALEGHLAAQAAVFRAKGIKVPSVSILKRAAQDLADGKDPESDTGFAAVGDAFAPLKMQDQWLLVARHFTVPPASCAVEKAELESVTSHLHRVFTESGRDQSSSIAVVLAPLQGWSAVKSRCLAISLAKSASLSVPEQRDFLLALMQSHAGLSRDTALSALMAQRLTEGLRFPEALATLVDLADQDPSFRLPYEILQRLFSAKQKGRGAVALQGL